MGCGCEKQKKDNTNTTNTTENTKTDITNLKLPEWAKEIARRVFKV